MPIVEMPDGAHVEFPDDMPADQIRSLIVGKFPELGHPQKPAQDRSMAAGVADIWNNPDGSPSLIGMAKTLYQGARGPGDALAGKFQHQPHTSGVWTEEDQFLADLAAKQEREAAAGTAAFGLASTAPSVAMRTRTPANKLAAEAQAGYKNAEANPAIFGPEIRNALADNIQARINESVNPEAVAGVVGPRIKDIREVPPAVAPGAPARDQMTIRELSNTRKLLNSLKTHNDPEVRKAAGIASNEILTFIERNEPQSGSALRRADQEYATSKRLGDIEKVSDLADFRTASRGTSDAIRKIINPIVEKAIKGNVRGWKPEEITALRELSESNNVGRRLSRVAEAVPFAGKPLVSPIFDKLGNILDKRAFERMNELVLKRSPAYRDAVEKSAGKFFTAADEFIVQPSNEKLAKLVGASRALSAGLTRDGIQITSGDLLRTIQGGKGAAADDEQPEP